MSPTDPPPPIEMTRYHLQVEFGDCDPARIVFFPNYFRWSDAASRHFFREGGVPRWEETERSHGIIGAPCLSATAQFLVPASYGDALAVESRIGEWRGKSFVFHHLVRRGDEDVARIEEVRVFARRTPDRPRGIEAVAMPAEWRARFL